MTTPHLLVGLGNPGGKYANNRHNVGFMAIDSIIGRYRMAPASTRSAGALADGTVDGNKVLTLKPTTFMNESGQAVGAVMRFYKLAPSDITVFHDELDLPPGKIRVKRGGGHGGHNGLRSIDAHIGQDYRRVRIGIGHPGEKNRVTGHVLHDFSKADDPWREALLDALASELPLLLTGDDAGFMTRVALLAPPPSTDPDEKGD